MKASKRRQMLKESDRAVIKRVRERLHRPAWNQQFHGTGPPPWALGNTGDAYLDTVKDEVYVKSDHWVKISMKVSCDAHEQQAQTTT